MATIVQILSAVYDAYMSTMAKAPNVRRTITYKDFKKAILESGIYVSDPSIRNAWTRIGSSYCIVNAGPGTREHPELRTYTFNVLYLAEILGEVAITPGKAREKKLCSEEVQ